MLTPRQSHSLGLKCINPSTVHVLSVFSPYCRCFNHLPSQQRKVKGPRGALRAVLWKYEIGSAPLCQFVQSLSIQRVFTLWTLRFIQKPSCYNRHAATTQNVTGKWKTEKKNCNFPTSPPAHKEALQAKGAQWSCRRSDDQHGIPDKLRT